MSTISTPSNSTATIAITMLVCKFADCGYSWPPRTANMPKQCPKCKRYGWELGRKPKKVSGGKHALLTTKASKKGIHSTANTLHEQEGQSIGPNTEKFMKEKTNK